MKKVIEYDLVRHMHYRDNLGKRTISRQTGLHRETIKKMLEYPEPPGYRFKIPRPKPRLAPFVLLIDQILEDNRKAPKKQRHTAKRIFDRLCAEHGYKGGYGLTPLAELSTNSKTKSKTKNKKRKKISLTSSHQGSYINHQSGTLFDRHTGTFFARRLH